MIGCRSVGNSTGDRIRRRMQGSSGAEWTGEVGASVEGVWKAVNSEKNMACEAGECVGVMEGMAVAWAV